MCVYEKVRDYISFHGLEADTVANEAGIPKETFRNILDGKAVLYAEEFRAICLALNVIPETFIQSRRRVTIPGIYLSTKGG